MKNYFKIIFIFSLFSTFTSCSEDTYQTPSLIGEWEIIKGGEIINGKEELWDNEQVEGCPRDFLRIKEFGMSVHEFKKIYESTNIDFNCKDEIYESYQYSRISDNKILINGFVTCIIEELTVNNLKLVLKDPIEIRDEVAIYKRKN